MIFEAIRDGKVIMSTTSEEAIPPSDQLKDMMKHGFAFKKDGKTYKPQSAKQQAKPTGPQTE